MWYVLESISAKSCLVYEKVGDLLGVEDCFPRMVYFVNAALFHAELYPVDSVSYTEPWIDNSLYHGHELFVRILCALVVERGDWGEELT